MSTRLLLILDSLSSSLYTITYVEAKSLVKAWALIHQEDLETNWALAMDDELPFRIEPLK